MIRAFVMMVVVSAAALLAPPALAQGSGDDKPQIGVSADIQQRQVYVGDQVRYEITVDGAGAAGDPVLDLPDGVVARQLQAYPEHSESMTYINGNVTRVVKDRYTIPYEITVKREGSFTIGPAKMTIDGKTYTTNRVQFSAREPGESSDVDVDVQLDAADLWVGQPVRAHVSWYVGAGIDPRQWSFDVTTLPDSFDVFDSPGAQRGSGSNVVQFTMLGHDLVGIVDEATRNGQRVQRLSFDLVFSPTKPGQFDLGPIAVVFNQLSGRSWVRSVARSDPMRVTVRPLPVDGRPDNFTGLVGVYDIDADASSTSVNVGDPIELRLRIRGDEPMNGVDSGPDLGVQGFADHFRLDSDGWERLPGARAGERLFSTTIRALSPEVTEIPPIRLAYFDTAAGEYRVAESDAIPLTVRSVREVTAADAVVAPGCPSVAQTPLDPGDPSFWAEDRGPGVLRPDGFDLRRAFRSPAWLGAIAVPPVAYAGVALFLAARARSSPEQRRRRRAFPNALRALRSGGPASGARRLVSDLLAREPSSVTAADCERFDLDDDTRKGLRAMLEADEATRFGAMPPSAGDSRRARDVLRRAARAGVCS